jgi:FkbM family methyltransferase
MRRKEWDARAAFLARAASETPYVALEADNDLLFFVSTTDRGVGRALFARRTRGDIKHLATTARLLVELGLDPSGTTFVDVGANIGTTTITAVCRHGFAGAVALEPSPPNFALLRLNLVANGVETDVTALEVAVADHDGVRKLGVSLGSGANKLIRQGRETTLDTVDVTATTLDSLVECRIIDPDAVGLLWIDTPSVETDVLAGASMLLDAGVPVVVVARGRAKWAKRSAALNDLLGGYTWFADLHADKPVTADLDGLLQSLAGRTTDLLAVKQPRARARTPRSTSAVRWLLRYVTDGKAVLNAQLALSALGSF